MDTFGHPYLAALPYVNVHSETDREERDTQTLPSNSKTYLHTSACFVDSLGFLVNRGGTLQRGLRDIREDRDLPRSWCFAREIRVPVQVLLKG